MINISRILIYVLQGCSGAVAGYITNKYAVNMLFKEYTPFKIGNKVILNYKVGGVIKNRKKEFVEEISSLVERDIINGKSLKESLASDKVRKEITNIFNTFLNKALSEAFNDKTLSKLKGFNNSIENIRVFTNENSEEILTGLLQKCAKNIDLNKLLSQKQIESVSENLYKLISEGINENSSILNTIDNIYNESSNIKVNDLISDNTIRIIKENINYIITDIIEEYFSNDENIIDLTNKLIDLSEIVEVIDSLQVKLKEKVLEDFIDDKEIEAFGIEISNYLCKYLKSNEGIKLTSDIIKEFIKIIKEIDLSLYDIMPNEIGERLTNFINEKLPIFLPYISEWILANKDEFDNIIEQSIDEGIENMDASIKRLIVSLVREHFLDDISTKNEVINKIVNFIEAYKLDNSEAKKLSTGIVKYLKNTKIKDIVIALENNNILNDNIINKVSEFVINELSNNGTNLVNQLLVMQKNKKIGDFVTVDFKEFFNKKGLEIISGFVLNKKESFKDIIFKFTSSKINSKIDSIKDKSIKDIIPDKLIKNIKDSSNEKIKGLLISNELALKKYLSNEIQREINKIDLSNVIEKNNSNIIEDIKSKLLDFEDFIFDKCNDIKIADIISKFNKGDKRIASISNEAAIYLENNLEDLLKGKIKTIVYDNLIKLNEDEICDLAQKFMGTELQPLSIFGGVLGLIGGLIFGLFSNNISLFGTYNNIYQLLGSILLMGLIGVFTNVIAIAMLFRPYKKNKFLAKIPFLKQFSLGYIPAHKSDLANGIGSVIDNEILNGIKIQELFKSKKETMNSSLVNLISNSNYKYLHDSLVKNKKFVCRYFYNKLIKASKDNNENISQILSDEILNIKTDRIINIIGKDYIDSTNINRKDTLYNKIGCVVKKQRDLLNKYLLTYLEKNINSDKRIVNLLPESLLNGIEDILDNLIKNKTQELLKESVIKDIIISSDAAYSTLTNKSLQNVFDNSKIEALKQVSFNKIEGFIYIDLRYILSCKIKEILTEELSDEKTIESMFNGNIKKLIYNNLSKISDFIIIKLTDIIAEKENYIGDFVKQNINSRLNFLQKMGYAMAGGDRIVDNCVNVAVNKNLPLFISKKVNEIEAIVGNSLNTIIYPVKLSDLNIGINEINSSDLIYNIFEGLANDKKLNKAINIINDELVDKIKELKIASLLLPLNLDNPEKLYLKFKNEIEFGRNEVIDNINKNSKSLVKYSKELFKDNLKPTIENITLQQVFNNLTENDIKYISEKAINLLLNSEALNDGVVNTLKEIYCKSFKNKDISIILNDELLTKDIKEVMYNVLINTEIQNELLLAIENIFDKLSKENFNILDIELKDDINKIVSEAILNVLIIHTKAILESLELKDITYKQIEKMDSKEINDLFDSFAGEYFKKLYGYGMVGAVFGINLWIPIIWAIIEYIRGKKNLN